MDMTAVARSQMAMTQVDVAMKALAAKQATGQSNNSVGSDSIFSKNSNNEKKFNSNPSIFM